MITLTLPYPPSVNHYWRRRGAQYFVSREGKAYREAVGWQVRAARAKPLDGAIDLSVRLTMPDRRRRDVDNVLKSLLDSLAHGGLYEDDSQIDKLTIERCGVLTPGQAIVTARSLEPAEDEIETWRRLV